MFALLLFELGEDIAKRRFFRGRGLVLEGVCDLLGLLFMRIARVRIYSGTLPRRSRIRITMAVVPSTFRRRWLRPQDFVWLFLFSALALVSTEPTREEIGLVFSLGLFQVVEPKVPWFSSGRGTVWSTSSNWHCATC